MTRIVLGIFYLEPYSLIVDEACVVDASASVVAFSSTSIAYSIVTHVASAASVALRPNIAEMSALMTSCAVDACCSATALSLAFSSAACFLSSSRFAFLFQLVYIAILLLSRAEPIALSDAR